MSPRDKKVRARRPFLDRSGATNESSKNERGDVRLVRIVLRIIFCFPSRVARRSAQMFDLAGNREARANVRFCVLFARLRRAHRRTRVAVMNCMHGFVQFIENGDLTCSSVGEIT